MSYSGKRVKYEVISVHDGYHRKSKDKILKRCSCSLIKGPKLNVIVNTMTPWDNYIVVAGLDSNGLKDSDINFVISTQPIYGFTGSNFAFNCSHIVGHSYTHKNTYLPEPFKHGNPLYLDGHSLKVIPTPGCTLKDVSVLVHTKKGTVAITGALFINKDDIKNDYETIRYRYGSYFPQLQMHSRQLIVKLADYIVPAYGEMFEVTEEIKESFLDRTYNLI